MCEKLVDTSAGAMLFYELMATELDIKTVVYRKKHPTLRPTS